MACLRIQALLALLVGLVVGAVAAQGVTLRVACTDTLPSHRLIRESAHEWAAQTGNKVVLVSTPNNSQDRLALAQTQLAARSPEIDIYELDVIWPGFLAEFLIDLSQHVSPEERAEFFPRLIEANTVNGRLIALPAYVDLGLLYYRTDLLSKYGYERPPDTWLELEEMARKVMEGEHATNPQFWGFVWNGHPDEGLTCTSLEWLVSNGAGNFMAPDGSVTFDTPRGADALRRARSWVGGISPHGCTSYISEDARGIFQSGNALFMRNWPYAYSMGQGEQSPIRGRFDVTVLPRGEGEGAVHAAALGGWQFGVSRYSEHPRAAAELVKHLTGPALQKSRAIVGSYTPSRMALFNDAEVLAAQPFMARMPEVVESAVARPSVAAGAAYSRVSFAVRQAVYNVLIGQQDPAAAVAATQARIERLIQNSKRRGNRGDDIGRS